MSANPDSVANQGEFHSRVPPSRPIDHHGHQIGQPIGKEAVHEFHAKTYPPGSAPPESTFYPNPIHEIPGQAMNPDMDPSLRTGALDIPGADSREIYNESGAGSRPIGPRETVHELRHLGGGRKPKKDRSGVAARGGTDITGDGSIEVKMRMVDKDRKVLGRGIPAEERIPASAEEIGSGGRPTSKR
ncbi:hypothetical protein B0T21DRAFT_383347 [Apiosordaria backusii]|uniref:Uncharacterized protein n=1 Tax=Apiosordaria backusii TaxID=314023 RepID=A0AA40EI94_9PEZI|nr:hypothetical protein B0T21DRAFT_383347 [Apiosordaria backusii]